MADITLSADDIATVLQKRLAGLSPTLEQNTVGHIIEVGDGIARVSGLPNATVNELLEFENGQLGLAVNLDDESNGAVVLGPWEESREVQTVRSTGRILSIRVGDGLLGRVVNPLGQPI